MELERKTMEQRREAELFYEHELMHLIEDEFVKNNKSKVSGRVQYLVVSVGTSYEPIVLNLKLLNPEHILFLYTEKSEQTLEKVVDYCELSLSDFERRKVSEVEPIDIYREIKRIFLLWEKPECMYVDITGGTKAMSSACALAGALIDIQMLYVSSVEYLVDFRKPRPGSERLNYIDNPIVVFGDMEIEKAVSLFSTYNFAGAREKFERLKDIIPDPELRQQMQFIFLLAKAYEAWDALDFRDAYENMKELNKQIKRDERYNPKFLLVDFSAKIEWQTQQLESLQVIPGYLKEKKNVEILKNNQIMHALMFTMYQNGVTRIRQEKYDMATLLFYRLLEMIAQRRLIRYELYVSKPEYKMIRYPVKRLQELVGLNETERLEWLKDRVYELRKALFKDVDRFLPAQIALLDGYTILAALKDPLIEKQNMDSVDVLKQLRSMVHLRNNSIFAHGLGPVGEASNLRFSEFVTGVFKLFCKIEDVSFKEIAEYMEWIMPQKSENYMRVWE